MSSPESQSSSLGKMIKLILETGEDELTCDDCYQYIDQYVEMLERGESPCGILRQVEQHISQCHCCSHEMSALISVLRKMQEDEAGMQGG